MHQRNATHTSIEEPAALVADGRSRPEVRPFPGTLGAEISGLTMGTLDAAWPTLKKAFLERHMLVLRNFHPSEDEFQALASRFGPIEDRYIFPQKSGATRTSVHMISNDDGQGKLAVNPAGLNANFFWHTDKQYYERPAMVTMLQAMELPPSGGDTQFADMTAAYDALPQSTKARIDGVQASYSYLHMLRTCMEREPTEEEISRETTAEHPLVRTHVETGRKSLYIGMYCAGLLRFDTKAGRDLLSQLTEHATSDEFVYTHPWRDGDVVLWDNRCLLHRAVPNYDMLGQRRVLRRVVTVGEVPF